MNIDFIEYVHQIIPFEDRDMNEAERLKWEAAMELGRKAEIRNKPLEYYLNELAVFREKTLMLLKTRQDSWLSEEGKWPLIIIGFGFT